MPDWTRAVLFVKQREEPPEAVIEHP